MTCTASLSPVVKYHGLARRHLQPLGFLMRPLLNGGTLGGLHTVSRQDSRDTDRAYRCAPSLAPLAATVRVSSNFRFAWQWFSCPETTLSGIDEARDILGAVIGRADCHTFLTESVDSSVFTIERLHEHVGFVAADGAFEQILARAAADQLGAYSRILSEATPAQVVEIQTLFGSLGPYRAFELNPGSVPGCPTCKDYNSHLFTSWFYGVAWDWLFCVRWTKSPLTSIASLSDTD